MSNQNMNQSTAAVPRERVINAAALYLERKGYEVLEREWAGGNGIVARDEETLVFVDVTANRAGEGGFGDGAERGQLELLAADWLGENEAEGDFPVRFDKLSMVVLGGERALLRHCINFQG